MRVLLINCVCGIKSTGRICTELAQKLENEGHEVKIAYGREESVPEKFKKYAIRIGNDLDVKIHAIRTRLLDEHGFGSKRATKKFLEWAEEYNPDMVWLHNIHGYYINVELLFEWIKSRPEMQVKWTLHDCWAFTGHCAHFLIAGCEQWKEKCMDCPQKEVYPTSKLKSNCRDNFERKKAAFTGIKNMTLITPSRWLANLTRESYLKDYPVEVQYNTINTEIFRPTESDFRYRYQLENKKILLGVSSAWTERKGFYDFIELSKMLNEDYVIVLVGISEEEFHVLENNDLLKAFVSKKKVDNRAVKEFPGGVVVPCDVNVLYRVITGNSVVEKSDQSASIICIPKTNNAIELAEIYTAADLFVNPTYEDTYPTVNLEARSCGTKVITYNTGGCAETLQ